jgi:paraquat-inducible protein B
MPVAGYNVVPDENDHEATISIDIEAVNEVLKGKACICIGEGYEQTTVHLDRDELQAFIAQAKETLSQMDGVQSAQEEAEDLRQNLEFALFHLKKTHLKGIQAAVQDALIGLQALKALIA